MRTFAEAEERLAEALPGYERRSQQQALAVSVEKAISERKHLLAEAGCGTGKSLGYLIPAILGGRRAIVSTATKALQDQIAEKDLPFLQEHLGVSFTFAVLKGRSNYLCLNKTHEADPAEVPSKAALLRHVDGDADWDGTRDSLPFEVADREWYAVAAETEDCQSYKCKDNKLCYAQMARDRAKASQVVVVNHALYLTDLKVREVTGGFASMLDEHDVVIFDEAHEVEEYASKALGSEFKEAGVRSLVTEIVNAVRRFAPEAQDDVEKLTDEVLASLTALWSVLQPGRIRSATLIEAADQFVAFANALADLDDYLNGPAMLDTTPTELLDMARKRKDRISRRTTSAARRFHEIVTASFDDLVRWVEIERTRRGQEYLALKSAPVTVAPYLREHLFDNGVTAVLTSATLSVDGRFDYIAGRLGVDDYDGIDVGTPFDYTRQSVLYVPRHLPEPTPLNRAAWSSMMAVEMAELVKASEGRALLLFTSNREMNQAYDAIAGMIPYTVLKQGTAPNNVLAQRFAEDTSSVLFATRSFFTGVDFQGEACSLVVIDKLPFPVPTEPLVEARTEAIKREGGNDFKEYTIPVMSLVLKQGFGRLIRHRNDRGVVAILDPRLLTKGYGKTILNSLPPAHRAEKVEGVVDFFGVAGVDA